MCITLIKTRMTHSSAKFSHNGLKAAVEGGGEEQVVDIRPSCSHVSNLFPVDASASDVTMYEGGFSTGVLSILFFHLYAAAGEAAAGTIFCYLSTTLPLVLVRRYLWHFPPALSAFACAVLETRDELWRWLYSTTGKMKQGSLFVSTFIFGFYTLRFFPQLFTSFLFSLPFLLIFLCIMLGVSVCRFNIYQARGTTSRVAGVPMAPVRGQGKTRSLLRCQYLCLFSLCGFCRYGGRGCLLSQIADSARCKEASAPGVRNPIARSCAINPLLVPPLITTPSLHGAVQRNASHDAHRGVSKERQCTHSIHNILFKLRARPHPLAGCWLALATCYLAPLYRPLPATNTPAREIQ